LFYFSFHLSLFSLCLSFLLHFRISVSLSVFLFLSAFIEFRISWWVAFSRMLHLLIFTVCVLKFLTNCV
jgi:hypothetical protein